jgi:hypothetical protein
MGNIAIFICRYFAIPQNNHDWENLIGEGSGKIISLGYVKLSLT